MVVVEEQDYCYSDSDSDDEDVDRYVFLARQPAAPDGRRAEDDHRDASSANDDDDDGGDGTAGEEESEGGVRKKTKKRRPLREILDDDAPPPTKKARLELIVASPLAAQTPPSGSESSSPRAGESGSDGSHEKAHEHRAPREHGKATNATKKKRAACGKRSRSPGGEADGDRDGVAAAAATAKTAGASSGTSATSGRFPCSLCDRCFHSHQALGGHVLGHRKRTKIAIAAGAILDADDAGEESAAVEVTEEPAKNIAQADKKVLVAARRGKATGDGSSDEGKAVDDTAEHGDEDVDRARHKRQRKVHGKGNGGGVRGPMFAGSHDEANGQGGFYKCNTIGVSGHGFNDGNFRSDDGKMDIGTASPKRKVGGAGTCHEGANGNGNGNGNGNVHRTRYKCKVCGTECFSGRALGGHMRKHRKRPPVVGGGGGERSPSPATDDDDCLQIPLAQLFGAETSLQREI